MITKRTIAGRLVNPIGLGGMSLSWAYGEPPSPEEGARILNRALDIGYDHIDTANLYGLGKNEELIGAALQTRRSDYFLATKMGIVADGPKRGIDCSPKAIHACIDASLQRLRTDHIDLYYFHRFDPKVPIAEMIGAMAELVKAGKIGAIGVSEWSAAQIREAAKTHPIAAVQTEYSLWTRNAEIAVLDICREIGTAFVAFSPVGRGALANGVRDMNALPERDLRHTMPRFDAEHWPANLKLIDAFNAIAAREGVTPAQLSLAWIHTQGDTIVSIPGTGRLAHLEENIARWDWELSGAVAAELDALINQNTVSGPRYRPAIQATIHTEEFA